MIYSPSRFHKADPDFEKFIIINADVANILSKESLNLFQKTRAIYKLVKALL